ncbi:hypothetical protein ACWC2T_09225 [Streptomyces sp. NPDC001393]
MLAPEAHFAGHGEWADRQIGGYRDMHTANFGERVSVPNPMNIELDTEILKNYVR